MQSVNDDMDHLMRQAAEACPVKPQGADWAAVAQRLQASGNEPPQGHGVLKKLLLIIPLLLASFVCDRFFRYGHGPLEKVETATGRTAMKNKTPDVAAAGSRPSAPAPARNGNPTKPAEAREPMRPVPMPPEKTGEPNRAARGSAIAMQQVSKAIAPPRSGVSKHSANDVFPEVIPLPSRVLFVPLTDHAVAKPAEAKPDRRIAGLPLHETKPLKTRHGLLKKAYIAALAGPDWSRVKTQRFETGYGTGLMLGYAVRRNWAVEAGVLWDKKVYNATGDQFKADKMYLPPHSQLLQVNGYCRMFEIPVAVRYNWKQSTEALFFATAGAASYLMQQEDYAYTYKRYDTYYSGHKVYKDASRNWFATAALSVGYERRLGARTGLRIEPYARLPLRGVGIGSLPLASTGVFVGIVQSIQ